MEAERVVAALVARRLALPGAHLRGSSPSADNGRRVAVCLKDPSAGEGKRASEPSPASSSIHIA